MSLYLGIDTSNYTTSCAAFDTNTGEMLSLKKLLPVKSGEKGIRQSDAVFHHTKQLPELMEQLLQGDRSVSGVSFSCAPRNVKGSYMPCFLAGESAARSVAAACGVSCYATHHQTGHILAALYSCKRLDLLKSNRSFLALHVSGGTTDLLLCKPDKENVINIEQIGGSLDLKAGQAVDRVGIMLGLDFPCGAELEKLAVKSEAKFSIKPVLKGTDCCLSGVENKCDAMLKSGACAEDTAKFCLEYIGCTVRAMTKAAIEKYGEIPVIFAGGVMSDKLIKDMLVSVCDGYFAQPEFSCDNAAGVALFGAIKEGKV
ncbi:MAG: peptidase M22 [Ruminococcus sp.]|nr:peptidase M22 [Ruminococcus sp.]